MYSIQVSIVYKGVSHDYASFQYIRKPRRVEYNTLPHLLSITCDIKRCQNSEDKVRICCCTETQEKKYEKKPMLL